MENRKKSMTKRARELRRNSTPTERRLWFILRDRRLAGFKFRRQKPFADYVLDFYCAEASLAVELDGESHLGKEERDRQREVDLEALGLKMLRFWDTDVYENQEGVLEVVLRECLARTTNPSRPTPLPSGERGGADNPSPPTPLPSGERGERDLP